MRLAILDDDDDDDYDDDYDDDDDDLHCRNVTLRKAQRHSCRCRIQLVVGTKR